MDDYVGLPSDLPGLIADTGAVGDGGRFANQLSSKVAAVDERWLQLVDYSNSDARQSLIGLNCGLCVDPWIVKSKHWTGY